MSSEGIFRKPLVRYAFAVLLPATGFMIRQGFTLLVGPGLPPYITFYPAVMVAALISGLWPGLLAAVLSTFVALLWVLPPFSASRITSGVDIVGLALFLGMDVFMCLVAEYFRRARQRAARFEKQLALRESEETIRKQREWLRVTLSSIGDAVLATDAAGRVTFVNPVGVMLTGWPEEKALGQPVADVFRIVNEQTRAPAEDIIARVLRDGLTISLANHTVLISRDGREVPIEDSAAPIKGASGDAIGVVVVFHDVTEKRRTQDSLRRQAGLLALSFDAIIVWKLNGGIESWNRGAEELYGYTEKEAVGRVTHDLLRTIHPVPWADIETLLRQHGRWEGELIHRSRDDREIIVSARLQLVQGTEGGESVLEKNRDITARKRDMEMLRRTAEDLARSNRDLEQFAYVASHDLQEPLRQVMGFTQLLRDRYRGRLDDKADEYLGFANEGAARMSQLVHDLLAYSRLSTGTSTREVTSSQHALDSALVNLEGAIKEAGARVTSDPLPSLPAEPAQLVQLLQNLVGNGLKFRHGGHDPVIHVSAELQGTDWVFSVRDNGIGIPADQFERVFQVFQRLHARGRYPGTGVGLSICRRIVERHGGRIWVKSVEGEGSTFFFSLPAGEEARE